MGLIDQGLSKFYELVISDLLKRIDNGTLLSDIKETIGDVKGNFKDYFKGKVLKLVIKTTNIDQVLEGFVGKELDRPLATYIVANNTDKLYYLEEATIPNIGIYLLKIYLDGLLSEIIPGLGPKHSEVLKNIWDRIKNNTANDTDLNEYRKRIQSELNLIRIITISQNDIKNAETKTICTLTPIIPAIDVDTRPANERASRLAESITNSIFTFEYIVVR